MGAIRKEIYKYGKRETRMNAAMLYWKCRYQNKLLAFRTDENRKGGMKGEGKGETEKRRERKREGVGKEGREGGN
jgi:hypothetical protein